MATSNVTLLLDGLLVLTATEGEQNGEVGVLGFDPLGHDLGLTVTRKHRGADIDIPVNQIDSDLWLQIEPRKSISVRDKTRVNRMDQMVKNPESYRWFVDLDDPEFYGFAIGADRSMFDPILRFNGGELFTATPPNDSVLDTHKLFGNPQHRGRVALVLGVAFKNATRAVFRNGNDVVFDSNDHPGDDYVINLSHNTDEHPTSSSDANWYYVGLGENIPLGQEILFSSNSTLVHQLGEVLEHMHMQAQTQAQGDSRMREPHILEKIEALIAKLRANGHILAGPEAACFPAYLSMSKMN